MDLIKLFIGVDATEGERALIRIAEALEAGEMPEKRDAELLIDAVELLKRSIQEKEKPQTRRMEFMRQLGMTKKPHREAGRFESREKRIAESYWWQRIMEGSDKAAKLDVIEEFHVSESAVKRAIEKHPKECRYVLGSLANVFGIEDERIQRGIKYLKKFEHRLRDKGTMPPEYEEWLEAKRQRHREQKKGS